MSEANYSIDRDLTEAQALADHLVPYVYENQLYGSIGGMFASGALPALTLGALLMRLRRLHALVSHLSAAQQAQLETVDARNDSVQREWSVHYNHKLLEEANSRLKMMDRYFADCVDEPRTCATNYPPEALRRTIVEDIRQALRRFNVPENGLQQTVGKIDGQLHRFTKPSDFIWANALQPAYPQSEYWWLYARPPRITVG